MTKKILLIILIYASIFIEGCSQASTKKQIQQSPTTTNTADTTKDNTTNKVNSNSNPSVISNPKNNSTTVQNEKSFYGQWVIEKAAGYLRGGAYTGDDIKRMVGKN